MPKIAQYALVLVFAAVVTALDIDLKPAIVVIAIGVLILCVLNILLAALNRWLYRRRVAQYPEWAAIVEGLEDIKAGRVRIFTSVADLLSDESEGD